MAATNYQRTLHKLWVLGDDAKLSKIVEEGVDTIYEHDSGVFPTIGKGSPHAHPKVKWLESYGYETKLTGTLTGTTLVFSGNLQGEALSADNLKGHIWPNSIIQRDSDRMQMRVDSVTDYAIFTVEVSAHGNNTLSNDSTAVSYTLLAPSSAAHDNTYRPGSIGRFYRYCGTQQFRTFIEMPYDIERTSYEKIGNELELQIGEKIKQMYGFIRNAVLHSEPVYSGGAYKFGDEAEYSSILGLLQWPKVLQSQLANTSVYVNKTSGGVAAALTDDDINGVVASLENDEKANFNRNGWTIACHPVQRRYMKDFLLGFRRLDMSDKKVGLSVDSYEADNGKVFKIVTDQHYPESVATIHNVSNAEWGFYKDYNMLVERLGIDATDITKKKITTMIYGVKFRKPRQNIGMIYGLPTTYSS